MVEYHESADELQNAMPDLPEPVPGVGLEFPTTLAEPPNTVAVPRTLLNDLVIHHKAAVDAVNVNLKGVTASNGQRALQAVDRVTSAINRILAEIPSDAKPQAENPEA